MANVKVGGPLPGTIYPNISVQEFSQQYVGKGFGELGGSFAYGVSTWSEQWQVPFDQNVDKVFSELVGWSTAGGPANAQGVSGTVMNRNLPKQHPLFSWLWVSRVSNPQAIGNRGQFNLANPGTSGGTLANWRQMRFTVEYESPPYDILNDKQVAGSDSQFFPAEAQRFCVWGREPANEFIQQEQDAFYWPYPGPTGSAGSVVQGSKGLALLLAKFRVSCEWVQVCDDWVRNGSVSFPYLDMCIGTVNQSEFMCMPPGTMLFEGYRATPRTMPARNNADGTAAGNSSNSGTVPRAWDIHLQWLYFNPCPTGGARASDGNFRYGHNLVFHIGTQKWWRPLLGSGVINSSTGGRDASAFWRYPENDHSFIFRQPSKTQSFYCGGNVKAKEQSIFN